jgi:hypothetical protein
MKIQENQMEINLNGRHQHQAYADDLNLLGGNTDTKNKIKGNINL